MHNNVIENAPGKRREGFTAPTFYGTGSVYDVEKFVHGWNIFLESRFAVPIIQDSEGLNQPAEVYSLDLRPPAEQLSTVREVFGLNVTELAGIFEVSRQAVYKWLSGASEPESTKSRRIKQLSRVAAKFQNAGVGRHGSMVKAKAFDGKSLLDLICSDSPYSHEVNLLIGEARVRASARRDLKKATHKLRASDDWKSSESIPSPLDE